MTESTPPVAGATRDETALPLRLERELQSGACRRDPARLRELLADDFEEVGASGRVLDRTAVLSLLQDELEDAPGIVMHDVVARVLGDGWVLVRWDSDRAGRRARRSSLWRRDPQGWRLVHHQGTLLP